MAADSPNKPGPGLCFNTWGAANGGPKEYFLSLCVSMLSLLKWLIVNPNESYKQ